MIIDTLNFFGTNETILGIVSIVGIVGFILTVIVTVKTGAISKILKYNQVTDNYNENREGYLRAFEGHRKSITELNDKSEKLLKTILAQVESYRVNFGEIISRSEMKTLNNFIGLLEQEANAVDWNEVCNYLAKLSGRLSKKEEKKNV